MAQLDDSVDTFHERTNMRTPKENARTAAAMRREMTHLVEQGGVIRGAAVSGDREDQAWDTFGPNLHDVSEPAPNVSPETATDVRQVVKVLVTVESLKAGSASAIDSLAEKLGVSELALTTERRAIVQGIGNILSAGMNAKRSRITVEDVTDA
jgi:hypothetical protein